jgi:hypothetical protein
MKLSTFLAVKAVISLVFAIAFVLIPATYLSWGGVTLDAAGTCMARFFGVGLLGIGLVCWFLRSAADSEARQGILLSLFITDTVGFIVNLLAQLSGLWNALGWINVAIWLLLALGLGYFRFLKPSAS